jgi:hypothetical protein
MSVNYVKVEQSRITTENPPRPRLTAMGYTVRAGSPTDARWVRGGGL